jgi:hypothetical protein
MRRWWRQFGTEHPDAQPPSSAGEWLGLLPGGRSTFDAQNRDAIFDAPNRDAETAARKTERETGAPNRDGEFQPVKNGVQNDAGN